MSKRYKGALLSATPPTISFAAAPGVWTPQQQFQAQGSSAWPRMPTYVEDVFSTYVYKGNGDIFQIIQTGLDLGAKGGLTWIKNRQAGATDHVLFDTARGANNALATNSTAAQTTGWLSSGRVFGFSGNGFVLGGTSDASIGSGAAGLNVNYSSWHFRKQPKFFDVVTYTGDGTNRAIAHNLGSVPGCVIVKATSTTGDWWVTHRSFAGPTEVLKLNTTDAIIAGSTVFNVNAGGPSPMVNLSSTYFAVTGAGGANTSGVTYVAYIFAHNAGGFGLNDTDNAISCGSYTGTGALQNIDIGFEPQWILIKSTNQAGTNWIIQDVVREMSISSGEKVLSPNLADAEVDQATAQVYPTVNGFTLPSNGTAWNANGGTYIYIAIRKGPMKVPTDATKVFSPVAFPGTGGAETTNAGFPVDTFIATDRNNSSSLVSYKQAWFDRLLGNGNGFVTSAITGWSGGWGDTYFNFASNTGINLIDATYVNKLATPYVHYSFRRAPGFFEQVAYIGDGATSSRAHNLGVTPELVILRCRSNSDNWLVWQPTSGAVNTNVVNLNNNLSQTNIGFALTASATTFDCYQNTSARTYIAYLFASCPGVSKVGTYTGTGAAQTINCGFAAGARFVLIKRMDSTGDWYFWDTARGIGAGNDPYQLMNSTAADVTNTDYLSPQASGFGLTSTAPSALNASGGTFLFLAIA